MGTQTFCASACFTVPAGVSTLKKVQVWGGGGAGGGGFNCSGGGGGGAGGYAASFCVPVTPGAKYNVTVGLQGQASNFKSNTVAANGGCGGHGGSGPCCSICGLGGPGGIGTAGCVRHTGATGGQAGFVNGGCGGVAFCGGPGGVGGHVGVNATAGTPPGAGGGGGGGHCSPHASAAGAHGRIKICWCCPVPSSGRSTPNGAGLLLLGVGLIVHGGRGMAQALAS